jgi:N-ethylmaleimide reductase
MAACPDILPTILDAVSFLQSIGVAYLHLVEADWEDARQFIETFWADIRARFQRAIVVAGKYDLARANWVLEKGYADLVAFDRAFVANPDLPSRLAQGLPLAAFSADTLFGGAQRGYTDYSAWPTDASMNRASVPSAQPLAEPELAA